jgi:protein-tyrosine-phosphatase
MAENEQGSSPFRVSVVCTANRFRSPIGASAFAAKLSGLGVEVDSMASSGPAGMPAVPQVAAQMAEKGIDLSAHRSTASQAGLLSGSDLVVCFEAHHAAAAIVEAGAPRERTFLMLELLDLLPPVRGGEQPLGFDAVGERLERAGKYRVGDFYDPRYQFADPMHGSPRAYRRSIDELYDLSTRVACRVVGLPEPEIDEAPEPVKPRGFFRRRRGNE